MKATVGLLVSMLWLTVSCDVGVLKRTPDGKVYARGIEKRHIGYGRWTKLAPDGLRDTTYMTKGSMDGIWKQFGPDGRIKSKIRLKAGVPEGVSTVWHANGNISLRGAYRAGLKHGPWLVWDPSGAINEALSGYYIDDSLVGGPVGGK